MKIPKNFILVTRAGTDETILINVLNISYVWEHRKTKVTVIKLDLHSQAFQIEANEKISDIAEKITETT